MTKTTKFAIAAFAFMMPAAGVFAQQSPSASAPANNDYCISQKDYVHIIATFAALDGVLGADVQPVIQTFQAFTTRQEQNSTVFCTSMANWMHIQEVIARLQGTLGSK